MQSKCPNTEAKGKTIEIRDVQKCAVALKLRLNSCQSASLTENNDLHSPLHEILRTVCFLPRFSCATVRLAQIKSAWQFGITIGFFLTWNRQ